MRYARASITSLFLVVLASVALLAACDDGGDEEIILATTTSTENSGLLDELLPVFEDDSDIKVQTIAVGTGAALEMARTGDADVVLVHAMEAEQEYVDSGDLIDGIFLMYNDFIIVGPADDPAGVAGAGSINDAMAAIAEYGGFTSRGDDSGTHQRELQLWEAAGISPDEVADREETGQGMGETLNVADQKQAYTLTDRATYLALSDDLGLDILFEGDPALLNPYHIYLVNPEQHDTVKEDPGREFIDFMTSEETQERIGNFGREEFGESLFIPTAGQNIEDVLGPQQ